jgi:hypothetical protein
MLLKILRRGRSYEVQTPPGLGAYMASDGRCGVLIPGAGAGAGPLWLTPACILASARRGSYGLVIRSEAAVGVTCPLAGCQRCC